MPLLLILFETLTPLPWDMQRSVKLNNSLLCWNVEPVGSIRKAIRHVTFQIKESNGFYQTPSLEASLQNTLWSGDRAALHSCLQGHCHPSPPLTSGKLLLVAYAAKVVSRDYRMLWGLKAIARSNLQCKQWPTLEAATQMSVCTFL